MHESSINVGIREGFRSILASSGLSIAEVARHTSIPRATLSRRIARGDVHLEEISVLGELAGMKASEVVAVMEAHARM